MPPASAPRSGLAGRMSLLAAGPALLAAGPALAHHLEGGVQPATAFAGLMSGLAHPVLGPDHLAFLLTIGLAGAGGQRRWVPALVACGLAGSLLGLARPGLPGVELLVALSLVAAGLVALERLPRPLMLPLIACHGYALAGVMVGAEPTPLLAYLTGLGLIQTGLLLGGLALFRAIGRARRGLAIGAIGIGLVSTLAVAFG